MHAIDPSIYTRKKHIEQIMGVNITVQLWRTFKDHMDGHNLTGCVFKNRRELKQDTARYDEKKIICCNANI